MDYLFAALVVVTGIAVMTAIYRLWPPKPFPTQKPGFCWFPKYSVPIELPVGVSQSSSPVTALERHLSELGFQLKGNSGDQLKFKRGLIVGDISVKLARVEMIFPATLDGNQHVTVQYGLVAAFDTGDLWTLASEVRQHIRAAA